MTEPLSDELIQRISPIRGAYSDIRPVIDYYRVTRENRLLFGAATPFVEHIPKDLKAWNRNLMLKIFPYLKDVRIDLAWGGPMATSANLFPQIGTLSNRPMPSTCRATPALASPPATSFARSSPKA
jgi:gamma-glutamylputrescine oxidase